jgi:hypothetical protein
MGVKFFPGFTVFGSGHGPAWVAPHAGPGFMFSDSRDDKSDVIAGLCWRKAGGKLIVSNASRVRDMGIDFNRAAPPFREAVKMHAAMRGDRPDQDVYYSYRKKYAWTASGKGDHDERQKIYRAFWREAGKSGTVVLLHRMFTTPKTAGSLIDVFTSGFEGKTLEKAVGKVNRTYAGFFRDIRKDLTECMKLDEKRMADYVSRTHAEYLEKEFVYNLESHAKLVGAGSAGEIASKIDGFMKHAEPKVTVRQIFSGAKSRGLDNLPRGTRIMQAEVTMFLAHWYPDVASDIICEILGGLQ